MTQTMLERAARAARGVQVGEDEEGYPVFPGPHTALELARAVLMAVREPSDSLSAAAQSTEGWEAMIDAILNEPQP